MSGDSICPRCGGAFVCGALANAPCDCFSVKLTDAARARLRAGFSECLCVACLRAVQAQCDQQDADPSTPSFNAAPPSGVR